MYQHYISDYKVEATPQWFHYQRQPHGKTKPRRMRNCKSQNSPNVEKTDYITAGNLSSSSLQHRSRKTKGLFGFSVFISHNSVSITHNSKMVGPMAEKSIWIFITLFPVNWVMSYRNWKHILGVFSFQWHFGN